MGSASTGFSRPLDWLLRSCLPLVWLASTALAQGPTSPVPGLPHQIRRLEFRRAYIDVGNDDHYKAWIVEMELVGKIDQTKSREYFIMKVETQFPLTAPRKAIDESAVGAGINPQISLPEFKFEFIPVRGKMGSSQVESAPFISYARSLRDAGLSTDLIAAQSVSRAFQKTWGPHLKFVTEAFVEGGVRYTQSISKNTMTGLHLGAGTDSGAVISMKDYELSAGAEYELKRLVGSRNDSRPGTLKQKEYSFRLEVQNLKRTYLPVFGAFWGREFNSNGLPGQEWKCNRLGFSLTYSR